MFSPEKLPDIIRKVDQWSQEELAENINNVVPVLTNSLKDVEQKSLSMRSINILLDRCLICVPVSRINSDILQYALPSANEIFTEALEGITVVLQDAENLSDDEMELTLESLHHVCFGLLNQFNNVLCTISSLCPLPAIKVASVPCSVLQILGTAFSHCRDSEELYGCARDHLAGLFKNSKTLLSNLEPLLHTGLQFNLNCEEDEILFKNVLEALGSVAKFTTTLGVSVQVVAWKMYVHLVEKYSAFQDLWASCDLSSPVETLSTSVADILTQMFEAHWTDISLGIKTLTVLSFLVRVLTKLCSVFTGHLTEICMPSIIRLLELLHRICVVDTCDKQTKSLLVRESEKRVGVASSSLISCLLSDRSFVQTYFSIQKQKKPNKFWGWLLMGASVCRALVSCESEIRKPWMCDFEDNILMSLFHLLGYCHNDLCGDMKFTLASGLGKPARVVDLYEHVLTTVGAFLLVVPPNSFNVIESALVKNIFQLDHWKGLFALDLWCIIARQSPTSVRVNHVLFVLQTLSSQQSVKCSPIQIHLRLLLRRLWTLLPSQQQEILLNKFSPALLSHVWEGVCLQSSETFEPNGALRDAKAAIEIFLANPNIHLYKEMVKKMKYTALLLSDENNVNKSISTQSNLASSLCSLWLLIGNPLMKFASEAWLFDFFCSVCDLTELLCTVLKNVQLIDILKRSLNIFTSGASHFKIKILTLLRAFAEKVFEFDTLQRNVFQAVVSIFVVALQDKNSVVQQEALCTFEYFAHVTTHEDIIKICLKSSKGLQEQITTYLKKTPNFVPSKTISNKYADYLKMQNKCVFTHQCLEKKKKPCYRNTATLEKIHKLPFYIPSNPEDGICEPDLSNAIQRLQTDSQFVLKHCKSSHLSKLVKMRLCGEMHLVMKSISEACHILKEELKLV
ncbi:hypothetical protein R5R35_002339 [Gryllus longicercus]|uniref:Uncharacterized protein n=1 Tax=Gryllus longicercus TaxID=2509291 RepID=A0AAN9VLF3_9ORTH